MKRKLLCLITVLCLIFTTVFALSSCTSEKLYDIEITTTTQIDHIQAIRFSTSGTKSPI